MQINQRNFYLIDSCALVHYFEQDENKLKYKILDDTSNGKAFYYIPQFCIAEVFNVFSKFHYRQPVKINKNQYDSLCNSFKYMIKNREILYAYDLHRYHNLNCDLIYQIEHTTPQAKDSKNKSKSKPYLSTFDILIIAMAIELTKIHGSMLILSRDARLIEIANKVGIKAGWYE